MNKYIIIKLPEKLSLANELKIMDLFNTCKFDFQWYNNGFATDEKLFV